MVSIQLKAIGNQRVPSLVDMIELKKVWLVAAIVREVRGKVLSKSIGIVRNTDILASVRDRVRYKVL